MRLCNNHLLVMLDVPEWANILKSKFSVGNGKHIPKKHVNVSLCEVTKMLPTAFLGLYYLTGVLFFFVISSRVKTLCLHST